MWAYDKADGVIIYINGRGDEVSFSVTKDKSLSAQFEHTCGVTESGFEIFTKSPAGLDKP